MNTRLQASTRVLSAFAIAMITITSVDSIRNLPTTALFGTSLIFFFIVGALLFLLPAALVSAELATTWPKRGGVYIWAREAFGVKWGFLAIWFQWIENVVWYPAILSFLGGTIAYLIDPKLATNKYYLTGVIWAVFWLVTLVNLRGLKASAWFSIFCGLTGLILPMIFIISLGILWVTSGNSLQISFAPQHLIPDLTDPSLLVSMTGVILSYSGIEIATVHAREARNPQRDYPRALLISVAVITVTLILGSLAIAIVVPHAKLSLVSGIMQAFTDFLTVYHLHWMIPLIALFVTLGLLGSTNNWALAPIKGLLVAAQDGNLPPILQRENHFSAPTALLIGQAIIVSLVSTVFIFMPNINSAYWLITVVAAQLYMMMYLIMFAASIYLRYKHPNIERPFKIPGGKFGIWLIAGMGFLASLFTLGIGLVPPKGIETVNIFEFDALIIGTFIIMSLPPFILYRYRKQHWSDVAATESLEH